MSELITAAVVTLTSEDVNENEIHLRQRAFNSDVEFSEMIVKIDGQNYSIQWDGFAALPSGVKR